MTPSEKRELVDSYKAWWHSIDVGDGVVTRGTKGGGAHIHQSEIQWFPSDFFKDKRVLDVGTWDGYYAFHAEKMGATEVVAVDYFVWNVLHELGHGSPSSRVSKRGFDIAKSLLNSKVKDYEIDMPDMTPEILGTFDSIIFAGIFYHMKNPFMILEILDSLLNDNGRILVETTLRNVGNPAPLMEFHPKKSLNNDPTNMWSPNMPCLKYMFEEIGNYVVESSTEYGRGTMVVRKLHK